MFSGGSFSVYGEKMRGAESPYLLQLVLPLGVSELHAANLGLQAVEMPQLGAVGLSGLPQLFQQPG